MGESGAGRAHGRLAWAVVWFTVAVILGGSIVRATGSGAGCGDTWPRCQSSIFPLGGSTETAIEALHRAATASLGVLLVLLVVWTWRVSARGAAVRGALGWSVAFFAGEVIIGAVLVLFGWVDDDASLGRIVMVPLHLLNTFFLLAALTVTAHLASGGRRAVIDSAARQTRLVVAGGLVLLVVAATGALNALADTLFPADSLLAGIADELAPSAHFLVRLRVLHPVVAIAGGILLAVLVGRDAVDPNGTALGLRRAIVWIVAVQFAIGFVNVLMATPVEVQVLHLLAADALWIAYVAMAARVVVVRSEPAVVSGSTR